MTFVFTILPSSSLRALPPSSLASAQLPDAGTNRYFTPSYSIDFTRSPSAKATYSSAAAGAVSCRSLGSAYMLLIKGRMVVTMITAGTKSRYGLHLPHLVRVLSTMVPIIGSFTASQTRASAKISEQATAGRKMTL